MAKRNIPDADLDKITGGAKRIEQNDPPSGEVIKIAPTPPPDPSEPPPDDRGTFVESESDLGGDDGYLDRN